MRPVTNVTAVFDAIQRAKAGAAAFTTNFFPVPAKLQGWIEHNELCQEVREESALFYRKDRDFWHLYYCSASVASLQRDIAAVAALKTERMAVDLVGTEESLGDAFRVMETSGFRRYARLIRLSRAHEAVVTTGDVELRFADEQDVPVIMSLLESAFDRYADQLPAPYEMEAAVAARQVLAIRCDNALAAILHFENQGLTSTVRYWVVDERFRSHRFGSALMRQYFAAHPATRRFILWVTATNDDAIAKYGHYGYRPDGLTDHVLVNRMIEQ